MNGFLQTIAADKVVEIASARARISELDLRASVRDLPPCRGFAEALSGQGTRIIAEVKRRSPSVPAFLQQGAPVLLAQLYANAGATALSLVTDSSRFGTSIEDIAPMRAGTSLPLIAKDFVIDPYQILALRASGADAVLLIARLLDDSRLDEFLNQARELDLDVLVECHDEADIRNALAAGARLVGINNRDLDSFIVSMDTSRSLLPLIPDTCLKVVESGLRGREEITELQSHGADAFLIGGSLLQSPDPAGHLHELLGRTV